MVMGGKYEYQSDFAKKHFAEGRQEGLRAALLTVIRARWGDEAAQRTEARLAAASLADLERWLAGAVTASTVDSLFSDA